MKLTVGSLFSGIGGLEHGLELTGLFKTIWNCEIDPYASAVLRKHWPDVPNLGDITQADWSAVEKPDLICGGFPCQDISIAGKGKGIVEGERSGLWREFAGAIRSLRPRYALVENVPELANRGLWLVLADLAEMGYDAEWQIVSAAEVGAPHIRERLFIMAYPKRLGCGSGGDNEREHESGAEGKQIEGIKGKWRLRPIISQDDAIISNTNSKLGTFGILARNCTESKGWDNNKKEWGFDWLKPEMGCEASAGIQEGGWNIPKSCFPRMVNGLPGTLDRIKCLGNAVVPQVAQVVGEMILEMEASL